MFALINPPNYIRNEMMFEKPIEMTIFASRWLMAPFYLGLSLMLGVLMVKFIQELIHIIPGVFAAGESEIILAALTLINLSLAGNLILMVVFSGYENFVSKIDVHNHEYRPDWIGKVDFSGLKLKLIASIVAISGIHLLKSFMNISQMNKDDLMGMVILHMAFVLSGVLLAFMDWLTSRTK